MTKWKDAPEAIPRINESTELTVRLPKKQVALLEEAARRRGRSVDVVVKEWIDAGLRLTLSDLKRTVNSP